MTDWVYLTLIVPDAYVNFARFASATLAGQAGADMLTTRANTTGTGSPTHWVTQGPFSPDFASLLPQTDYSTTPATTTPGRADLVASLANQAGFSVSVEQVQAMFDASDISTQSLFEALARMSLKFMDESS